MEQAEERPNVFGQQLFTYLKLAPEYRELWATGGAIGTVELGGVTYSVRCATELDAAKIADMTGKSVFSGFNVIRDTTAQQLLVIAGMALDQNDALKGGELGPLQRLPFNQHIRLVEVVSAFLWAGQV